MRSVRLLFVALTLAFIPVFTEAADQDSSISGSRPAARPPGPILYRYRINSLRSRITFTFRGGLIPKDAYFTVMEGEIFLGPGGRFGGSKGNVVVQSASVKTKDRDHLANLRNQVLEVGRYPRIQLRVDAAKSVGDPVEYRLEREWKVNARGRLLMHGVEKEIPLRFRLTDSGAEIYIRGEGSLDLSRFNMSSPGGLLLVPGSGRMKVRVRLVAKPLPR